MTSRTADLHTHTFFSDGTNSPDQLILLAKQVGLSAIAITDHDNTDAMGVAQGLAQREGIDLIPGIELSASMEGAEVHILGYFFDEKNPMLQAHIARQQQRRIARVREMVSQLQKLGIEIDAEEVLQLAGEGTVGRPHVARVLLKHGYVSSVAEAFSRYLGDGLPAFVPGSPLVPAEVIQLVRQAGGVPVLAHPVFLKRDVLIEQFVQEGLMGLEVYHSSHTVDVIRRYEQIADVLKLLKTGGSDYHGDSKEGLPVGTSRVPYALVDALRSGKSSLKAAKI